MKKAVSFAVVLLFLGQATTAYIDPGLASEPQERQEQWYYSSYAAVAVTAPRPQNAKPQTATNAVTAVTEDSVTFGIPVLANKDNTLPKDYVPQLVTVPGTYFQLEQETLDAYQKMLADAKSAGHKKLRLQSAYRSYATQNVLHENKVAKLKWQHGDKAREVAATIVARPGQSEHQLGNTIDIANGSLVQSFGQTDAGKWLAANAHKYGFILRYPEGKTDITGVIYEPWHFRYLGVDFAAYIYENDLTLEEYIASL